MPNELLTRPRAFALAGQVTWPDAMKRGKLKSRNWTSQDLTMRHQIAGVDNARTDNVRP